MEMFQVVKERLGFVYRRFTTVLVMFFIALPVLFILSMMSRNSKFDLSAVFGAKVQNVTALDSKYESYHPTSIPDDKLLNETVANGLDKGSEPKYEASQPSSSLESKLFDESLAPRYSQVSEYESSQPTSIPDDNQLNGTLPSRSRGESEYEASQPTSTPDEKQFNGTLASRFDGGSVPENESFQSTSTLNDNLFNKTLARTFGERSGSRDDSSQSSRIANDKLLDGLILPGFDENSCLSRYQSVLYRRISPHKPSPFLLSKLRTYESLHKRCGPYTKSYKRTLKMLKSSSIASSTECKYIIWRPVNGLGNRIVSMVSSFLYAVLTDRVLLVDHEKDMADLFCEPFPNTSWLLPKDFPLRNQFRKSEMRYAHSLTGILEKGSMNISTESTPYLYLSIRKSENDLDKKLFFCDQSQALLRNVPWLVMLSAQYFVPSLFLIQSFKKEVTEMFPQKDTVFHHLGRYLFNPSNTVWRQLISRFYNKNLAKADERIGLQIRLFHPNAAQFQTVMDQILACSLKEKLLPEINPKKSVSSSIKSSKVILIASLYSEFYRNLSMMYKSESTLTGEEIRVYQPSQEGSQHRGDNIHNMKAWAEIYLLSLCDVLVTSASSTFGYVAQGLGGLKPWILHKPGHGIYLPCKRAISMEPCFHFPVSYDCNSFKKLYAGSIVPHIRQCEDREFGVKLVNDHEKL